MNSLTGTPAFFRQRPFGVLVEPRCAHASEAPSCVSRPRHGAPPRACSLRADASVGRLGTRRVEPGVEPTVRPPSVGGSRGRTRRRSAHVRAVHRPSPASCRAGPGRGPHALPQLHRHRAHPARADPRGRRRRGQGAGVPRHLPGGGARPGRGDHRPGPAGPLRSHPLHPPRQEGARAVPARGAAARPLLHRHRAHPARPHPRGRGRGRPGPPEARRRPQPRAPAGHPAAQRLPGQGVDRVRRDAPAARPPRRRRARWSSTSSAATSPRPPARASSTR